MRADRTAFQARRKKKGRDHSRPPTLTSVRNLSLKRRAAAQRPAAAGDRGEPRNDERGASNKHEPILDPAINERSADQNKPCAKQDKRDEPCRFKRLRKIEALAACARGSGAFNAAEVRRFNLRGARGGLRGS